METQTKTYCKLADQNDATEFLKRKLFLNKHTHTL